MRYIGSKVLMLDRIGSVISDFTEDVQSVTDVFSGTGVVARYFKKHAYSVYANDLLYFSYVLNKGFLEMSTPITKQVRDMVDYLNNLSPQNASWFDLGSAFIYQNYSPSEYSKRMYFQSSNALKIDLIRQAIERLKDEISEVEYFYLLSLLINAVPSVSNITGTYGAYLKFWDKRTYNPLVLQEKKIEMCTTNCRCYNMNAIDLANVVKSDLMYLDPPYNGRQYMSNYHLLETIAKYDYPTIKGVTGMRVDPEKMSDFCKKSKAEDAFRELLGSLNCKYILLSYNNESLLSTEKMTQIVCEAGDPRTFKLLEYDHRRYKNKIPNNKIGLKEQLYFIKKAK